MKTSKSWQFVHSVKCCILHGCKLNALDCPVTLGLIKQKHLCNDCELDIILSPGMIDDKKSQWDKINELRKLKSRKYKLKRIT